MKRKYDKKKIMNHYYSNEELLEMIKMPAGRAVKWLENARRFVNKVTPDGIKSLQKKLANEGW